MRRPALLLLALPILAACATHETGTSAPGSYASDRDRLERECDARGGALVPSGRLTSQPETSYTCRIEGPETRPR